MFNRKQTEIDMLNARCAELAGKVRDKNIELKIAKHNNELLIQENLAVYNENKDLRFENEELREKIVNLENNINLLTNSTGNKIIKELVNDCESQN